MINLVGRELELVAAEGVRKTEHHVAELALAETGDEIGHLEPDAPEEFVDHAVVEALDAGLVLDDTGKLGIGDTQLLALGLLLQEFLEILAQLALHDGSRGRERLGRVAELLEGLQRHPERARRRIIVCDVKLKISDRSGVKIASPEGKIERVFQCNYDI